MKNKVRDLKGPIIIIGGSGFIGANILRECLKYRDDVIGTYFSGDSWRISDIPSQNLFFLNIKDSLSVEDLLLKFNPKTIFDCSSFGAYSFENDIKSIHQTNYQNFINLIEKVKEKNVEAFVHSGSSSEYGLNSDSPSEDSFLIPNSHYAISKAATSQAITYYGKVELFPIVNLRLYSVYGEYEDSSRLIPVLCKENLEKKLPSFARKKISRDFIYISDVVRAFLDTAIKLYSDTKLYGESINIGTGRKTSLEELSEVSKGLFNIHDEAVFSDRNGRPWDVDNWVSNPNKALELLGWKAEVPLEVGLEKTYNWWKSWLENHEFSRLTKKKENIQEKSSISAIVACYRDNEAIPIMYERLKNVFLKNHINYEIIFVNDCSPDNTIDIIQEISSKDPNVIGINHSRNFGSQAAFRSGMELCSKEACVLLDGDLQDPPELIEDFIIEWRKGADIVYGERVKRDMSKSLEFFYKGFYQLFSFLSDIPIPKNAGDFSLINREAIHWILECKEKDSFLRGLRAYVGFKQAGVTYIRPERAFGVSTNNWLKNIQWAKKGIFSFSKTPLNALTMVGGITFFITIVLALVSIGVRMFDPNSVPKGLTFISLLIMFFGSFTILGIGILGEYIGKILDESKSRPAFIRRSVIKHGNIHKSD
jgi:dolichol-phosphate mannosyltransferase